MNLPQQSISKMTWPRNNNAVWKRLTKSRHKIFRPTNLSKRKSTTLIMTISSTETRQSKGKIIWSNRRLRDVNRCRDICFGSRRRFPNEFSKCVTNKQKNLLKDAPLNQKRWVDRVLKWHMAWKVWPIEWVKPKRSADNLLLNRRMSWRGIWLKSVTFSLKLIEKVNKLWEKIR